MINQQPCIYNCAFAYATIHRIFYVSDKNIDYDVTVLCTEYDHWHADIGKNKKNIRKGLENEDSDLVQETNQQRSLQGTSGEELIKLQSNWIEDKTSYRDSIN